MGCICVHSHERWPIRNWQLAVCFSLIHIRGIIYLNYSIIFYLLNTLITSMTYEELHFLSNCRNCLEFKHPSVSDFPQTKIICWRLLVYEIILSTSSASIIHRCSRRQIHVFSLVLEETFSDSLSKTTSPAMTHISNLIHC